MSAVSHPLPCYRALDLGLRIRALCPGCGDVQDITTNGGATAPETDCSMACSGDPLHLCGGPQRLQLYLWSGTLTNWQTPSNIGFYEVRTSVHVYRIQLKDYQSTQYLIPGLVPPLLATVGINGKVSFLEKGGTSEFANSTGAYELDLSLVPDFNTAWREMHVQTDVFCSGAVVLPDKAARILNVGGWSLTSTFGVRLYAPDGSAGVNGTNDWEENPQLLHLQVGVACSASRETPWSLTRHAYRVDVGIRAL